MVRIGTIQFGSILIGGERYYHDVYILPWEEVIKRKSTHLVTLQELKKFENTNKIVIGTGLSGRCKVSEEAREYARIKGIKLLIEKTPEAAEIYNKLKGQKGAILHITC